MGHPDYVYRPQSEAHRQKRSEIMKRIRGDRVSRNVPAVLVRMNRAARDNQSWLARYGDEIGLVVGILAHRSDGRHALLVEFSDAKLTGLLFDDFVLADNGGVQRG